MFILYIMAFLPVLVGFVLWMYSPKINVFEWLGACVVGFLTCLIFHLCAINGMTSDTQVLSGRINSAKYFPEWVEKYKHAVYKTETYTVMVPRLVGKHHTLRSETRTRRVFSHYEDRYRTHEQYWECSESFGTHNISKAFFDEICQKFNCPPVQTAGSKSGFYSGDPNIYVTSNNSGYIFPTVTTTTFENKVKACPSVFSYVSVPEGTKVFEYQFPQHWRQEKRIYGGSEITELAWGQMNSRLGPVKKVNLILVNFTGQDSSIAEFQEAKFIGGKKNDVVICYGTNWCKVFGWTEKELVKRNIETIFLTNPKNDDIIPKIENEIITNYEIKDWSKWDYLSVEPPLWSYWVLGALMLFSQFLVWTFAFMNEVDKTETPSGF